MNQKFFKVNFLQQKTKDRSSKNLKYLKKCRVKILTNLIKPSGDRTNWSSTIMQLFGLISSIFLFFLVALESLVSFGNLIRNARIFLSLFKDRFFVSSVLNSPPDEAVRFLSLSSKKGEDSLHLITAFWMNFTLLGVKVL